MHFEKDCITVENVLSFKGVKFMGEFHKYQISLSRYWAGMKLKKNKKFFHVLCMYLSSKHAEMHSNTILLHFY
jgi:hypothetical protein